ADADFLRVLVQSSELNWKLQFTSDGRDAVERLTMAGPYANQPLPNLILMDLNLPPHGGRDILQRRAADERLRLIPVIVLSTSNAPRDVEDAYRLGANAFVVKPVGIDRFTRLLKTVDSFWFEFCELAAQC